MAVFLRPVADDRESAAVVALEIDAQEKSAIGAKLLGAQRLAIRQVVIEEGLLAMQMLQRRVRGVCLAPHEPDLIERLTRLAP